MAGIYHKPGERPFVLPCSLFGGRSPVTRKKVGERHRWSEGNGKGRCEFCGYYKDQVLSKPEKPERTLDQIIADATEPPHDHR